MAVRIYKDAAGNYRRNNDIITIGDYRLNYNADRTRASIRGATDYFPLVDIQLVTDYQDEGGTPYADYLELEAALEGLITVNISDMLNDSNFALQVGLGKIRGVYTVNKFGENPEVTSQSAPEDIWDFGGLYNFSTSAIIDSISSSGADTIEMSVEGLDANWDRVIQTVTLTGQVRVALPTPLIRVYRSNNADSIDLVGDVYIYEDTTLSLGIPVDTTKIRALVKADSNQTEMMVFAVPSGKTAAYLEGFVSIARGGGVAANADFTLRTREFGKVFRVQRRISINSNGGAWRSVYSVPTIMTEKTDLIFRCEAVSATIGVAGGFQAYIFDNVIWGL